MNKRGVLSNPLVRLILWASIAILIASASVAAQSAKTRRAQQRIGLEEYREAEQRLSDLGYWTGPVDGNFDVASRHALIAFQKVEGRERTGKLTLNELAAIRSAAPPVPHQTGFAHVEIDIKRQVLFVVDDANVVSHILPVCTGNEQLYRDQGKIQRAHTPRGNFKVLHKIGGWRRSTLGLLYYPNYIHGGIAIHGSLSMPVRPASHGCIRIPMFAAREFSKMAPVGTAVIVHDG